MLLNVHESTHSSTVVTLGDHSHGSKVKFQDITGLSSCNIDLHSVTDLNVRVRVSQSTSVMGDGARDLSGTDIDLIDSAKLVLSFFSLDAVQDVASLGVVQQSEAIVRLFQLDDIHETGRVILVSADLSVHLDATFHADLLAFLSSQSILETLTKDDSNRQAFSKLVRSSRRAGSPDPCHLSKVPVTRRTEAFLVLSWSTCPTLDKQSE